MIETFKSLERTIRVSLTLQPAVLQDGNVLLNNHWIGRAAPCTTVDCGEWEAVGRKLDRWHTTSQQEALEMLAYAFLREQAGEDDE